MDEVAFMENGWRFVWYAPFDIDLVLIEKLMWRWYGTDREWIEIYVLLMALITSYYTQYRTLN